MTRGRYIAFEGLEGCGKSTHVTRLAATLNGITTREPGGTSIGASLRAAMLDTSNTMLASRRSTDDGCRPRPTLGGVSASSA